VNNVYLSYSGRSAYLTCPKRYKFRYIDEKPEVSDRRTSLFGIVIGKIFEWFYERKFWAESDVVKVSLDSIESALNGVLEKEKIQIDNEFREKLLADLTYFVPFGVKTIKDNKLLSFNSRAEVKLDVIYRFDDLEIKIGGRADFIHISDNVVWILDGKGSRWKDKYVDPEQLIWYATQFFLKYHVAPARLGFVFWKFPEDPIQWISYNDDSIRINLKQTVNVIRRILNKEFDSKQTSYCNLCGYAQHCEDGTAYITAHKLTKTNRVQDSVLDIEVI
jgi:CRISPR/Cas system-associated exonuclease Cas4 (RecB family)